MTTHPVQPTRHTTDDELVAWREAYLGRGLPRPTRQDRWQVLRGGVANLWEFDTAEYWYADGWVQLTGRNETGKSSLMALTTLIPWLGDVSPNNIDTLGTGRGKQFRYYVEPTGADGDRRTTTDATASRGWLWVEYGRLTPGGEPEFFTTLGFFEARRAAQDYRRDWVTVEGTPRVRAGLDLVVARAVRTPADLAKQAPGTVRHQSAGAYRSHVASRLFGSGPDVLESIGKMLRVARTPKLGQALSEHFVTSQLRDSLPSLEPSEVGKLAEGWDELDKIRVDVETTKAAVDALRGYITRSWRPFQQAVLRQSADLASTARSRLEDVTRRVRQADEQLAAATGRQAALDASIEQHTHRVAADEHAEKELLQSSRYQDAAQRVQQVAHLRAQLTQAGQRHDEESAALRRAEARLSESETGLAAAQAELARSTERLARTCTTLTQALEPVGVPEHHALVEAEDWARLRVALQDRVQHLTRLAELLRAFAADDLRARSQEDRAAERRAIAADAATQAEQAWTLAGQARDGLAVALARWAAALPDSWPVPEGFVDALVSGLPGRADDDSVRVADRVRAEWFTGHDQALDEHLRRMRQRADELAARRAELEAERDRLTAAPDPVLPVSAGLRRRERPRHGPDGAPLWRLLDAPGLPDAELAAVEAALTAMGLLDVWVTPDGGYDPHRDGLDTVLRDGLAPQRSSLAAVVGCVDVPGPRRDLVERLLSGIGWQEQAPYAIWPDGRWQTPERAGRAELASDTAELIGETTRQRARERRLAQVREQMEELDGQAAEVHQETSEVTRQRSLLAARLTAAPGDDDLRAALARAADRDTHAADADRAATTAEDEAAALRAAADRSRASASEHAADHRLPTRDEDRDRLAAGLGEARDRVRDAEQAQEWVRERTTSVESATARAGQDREDHDRAVTAVAEARARRDELEHSLALLEATLDAGTSDVLAEADRLRVAIETGRRTVQELTGQAGDLRERVGAARAQKENAERDRADRERERDEAYEDFRGLLDHGVAGELALDLPDPQARTVAATRAQVAVVREKVTPRDWPAEARAKQDRVQRARDKLQQLDELRIRLEQGGRTVRLADGVRLPELEIVVDANAPYPPQEAMRRLTAIHEDLGRAYDKAMRDTLEELLGSTFIDHLRKRLAAVDSLVNRINDVLVRHPTGTTRTVLRIRLEPAQGSSRAVLAALRGSASLFDEATQTQVREFLRTRIEEARAASVDEGEVDWGERLAEALDYRQWWDVQLQMRPGEGGRWTGLNATTFNLHSGGARVVLLMLPLIATLIALYESTPGAPRPFWLDEAFDGLDQLNRTMLLELLGEFDLDVLLAGPGRLLNSAAVRAGAIFQVVRAEYPHPGADLTCELWAGQELTPLEPDELTVAEDAADTLFGVDL